MRRLRNRLGTCSRPGRGLTRFAILQVREGVPCRALSIGRLGVTFQPATFQPARCAGKGILFGAARRAKRAPPIERGRVKRGRKRTQRLCSYLIRAGCASAEHARSQDDRRRPPFAVRRPHRNTLSTSDAFAFGPVPGRSCVTPSPAMRHRITEHSCRLCAFLGAGRDHGECDMVVDAVLWGISAAAIALIAVGCRMTRPARELAEKASEEKLEKLEKVDQAA